MSAFSNLLLFILTLGLFHSCGQESEKALSAKNKAKYHLTRGECAKARKALDEVTDQDSDEIYVILYSNTYACEAGFSETDILNEVGVIAAGASQTLGSLTLLSSSNETAPDSSSYQSLMAAIEVIINSGTSAAQRINKFGANGGSDINLRQMFLILTELGKFIQYYGNASGGSKGGAGDHTCFIDYTNTDAQNWVTSSGSTGACVTVNDGGPDLPGPADGATTMRRLCEGITLFNHLRDSLSNLDLGDNTDFGDLGDIASALNSAVDAAEGLPGGASITAGKDILSVTECEDALGAADLEIWYAYIFESGFP